MTELPAGETNVLVISLQAEIKRLREVLDFYAFGFRRDEYPGPTQELLKDKGERARKALHGES